MNKKFGFIKEINIKTIMERIFMSVLAEEVEVTTTNTTEPTTETDKVTTTTEESKKDYQVNFEDLVAKARKEEKDKLYPQIKSLQKEVGELTEKLNAGLLNIEAKDKEILDLTANIEEQKTSTSKSDDEVVKTLKKEVKNLNQKIADLEKEKVDITEVENAIKSEYEVKLYREQKLREGGNEVIPELVTGVTKEDIDSSFEVAKQRYSDIIKDVVSDATTKLPINNANTHKLTSKDLKAEDIANMSPKEWAQYRTKLGLK